MCVLIFLRTFYWSNDFNSLCVCVCVCVGVYDSPISCFSTYRSLNAIPHCSHSIISWTTHTHLRRVDLNLTLRHTQPRTHWHSAHSCALSQALCVKQVDLCLLSLSLRPFFLFLSFYICHHLSLSHSHVPYKTCAPTHMQTIETSRIVALL